MDNTARNSLLGVRVWREIQITITVEKKCTSYPCKKAKYFVRSAASILFTRYIRASKCAS